MKRRRRLLLVVLSITFTLWVIFVWCGNRIYQANKKRSYFTVDDNDIAFKIRSNGEQSEYIDKKVCVGYKRVLKFGMTLV